MIIFTFFKPVLDALNDGKVIRFSIALFLQIFGEIVILGGIYFLIEILKSSFRLPTEGTIGGLLFSVIFLSSILAIAQIFFYRAKDILSLEESQFTIIPIFSILFRCFGEIYATLGAAIGVGGCFLIWFSGYDARSFFPLFYLTKNTFLDGLLFFVSIFIFSFIVIIVFYFLAESIIVLVDIAKNIRKLTTTEKNFKEVKTFKSITNCPQCGAKIAAEDIFCLNCGYKLT